jgi:hypothetical protein
MAGADDDDDIFSPLGNPYSLSRHYDLVSSLNKTLTHARLSSCDLPAQERWDSLCGEASPLLRKG